MVIVALSLNAEVTVKEIAYVAVAPGVAGDAAATNCVTLVPGPAAVAVVDITPKRAVSGATARTTRPR